MSEKKKIIDEKGKLFGKVNIIDLIVLALLAVVIVIVGMKLLNRTNNIPGEAAGSQIKYTVLTTRIPQEVYDAVEAEMAKGGNATVLMANGEILAGSYVESVSATPCMTTVETAEGTMVRSEEPGFVDVVFEIHASIANPITQAVGTQEVRVGKSHIVKTVSFELVNGVILSVELVAAN